MEMEPGQMKMEIPIQNNIYLKVHKTALTMEIRKVPKGGIQKTKPFQTVNALP